MQLSKHSSNVAGIQLDFTEPRIWLVPSGGKKDEHRDGGGGGTGCLEGAEIALQD